MNKVTWVVGGLILVLAVLGAYFLTNHSSAPAPAQSTGTGNVAVGANGASSIITYSDQGFSPNSLSVAQGTTITWMNQSQHAMWIEGTGPSSGNCAANTQGALNECKSVSEGGTYSYTFTRIGTFPYSNHAKSSDTGTITVSQASVSGPINSQAVPE